jgi:signal transduction histidine kinase
MKYWVRGKGVGLVVFAVVAALVAGGLGWATAAALRLEREQLEARAEADRSGKLRLALWRLDALVGPDLARENGRPYNHYSAVFAPALALRNDGRPWPPGAALELSPLLSAALPEWMLLHFQVGDAGSWGSPEVLSAALARRLQDPQLKASLANVTPRRRELLAELAAGLAPPDLLARVQERASTLVLNEPALLVAGNRALDNYAAAPNQQAQVLDPEYRNRAGRMGGYNQSQQAAVENDWTVARGNSLRNGEDWFKNADGRAPALNEPVAVEFSPLVPLWAPARTGPDKLLAARRVQVGKRRLCQGILLDWPRLRELLLAEVEDLFPGADLQPVREDVPAEPERTMTALPLRLVPAEAEATPAPAEWTPLRVGLVLAWAAALTALLTVALGGWSLLDLSERRIRFVSAVTHELRTPLTTLRLYLDMLTGGLVKEDRQKEEYLHTLHAESERLHRLVANVLDFSRLENQRPRLATARVAVGDLLEQVRAAWQQRCQDLGKELVVEADRARGLALVTDAQLVQQVLGNLIDNACKYSRGAEDPHVWLRARPERGRLVLEVEDRGPGVPARERRSIFRPFRRGRAADVTAGGVGLGLALAQRWAHLLGGKLSLCGHSSTAGACFRLVLPLPRPRVVHE